MWIIYVDDLSTINLVLPLLRPWLARPITYVDACAFPLTDEMRQGSREAFRGTVPEPDACGVKHISRILLAMSDPVTRLNAALEGRYAIERPEE